MRHWFVAMCAGVVLMQGTYSGVRVLVSYRVLELGGGVVEIGIVTAAFALSPVVAAMAIGRLVDRNRGIAVMRAGGVLTVLATAALAVSPNVVLLTIGFIFLGLGQTLFVIASQAIALRLSAPDRVDRTFAGMLFAVSLGHSIGVPMAGLAASFTERSGAVETMPSLLLMSLLAAVGIPFILAIRAGSRAGSLAGLDSVAGSHARQRVVEIVAISGMKPALFAGISVLVAMDLLTAYLPVVGQQHGFGVLAVSALLTARTLASLVARLLLPSLMRYFSRRSLQVAGTLGSALPMVLVPVFPDPAFLAVTLAVAGFFWGISQPLALTWALGLVPLRTSGTVLSLRLMSNRLGQFLLPLGATVVVTAAGASTVFFLLAFMLAAAGGITWRALGASPSNRA